MLARIPRIRAILTERQNECAARVIRDNQPLVSGLITELEVRTEVAAAYPKLAKLPLLVKPSFRFISFAREVGTVWGELTLAELQAAGIPVTASTKSTSEFAYFSMSSSSGAALGKQVRYAESQLDRLMLIIRARRALKTGDRTELLTRGINVLALDDQSMTYEKLGAKCTINIGNDDVSMLKRRVKSVVFEIARRFILGFSPAIFEDDPAILR